MGNHDCPSAELHKPRQDHIYTISACHHTVIDAGKLFNPEGNGYPGVYELGETPHDLTVLHPDRSDLDDLIPESGKSCCLNIKYHKGSAHGLPFAVLHDSFHVIHQISFHTVDHLKIRIRRYNTAPGIKAVVGLRESLHHTVVCNSNGPVSPLIGPFNDGLRIRHTVHVTHLGMAVKLHPLLRAGVCPGTGKGGNLLDSHHTSDGQLTVIPVNGGHTLQFQKGFLLHALQDLTHLVISGEHLHCDGIRKIRDGKNDDGLLISDLPGLQCHDLTAYADLAHLRLDAFQGNGLIFKISAVDHIRVVGALDAALIIAETAVSFSETLPALSVLPFVFLPVFGGFLLLPGCFSCRSVCLFLFL